MKIFRQILSGALALALAISTPMASLADEGLGGNTNSGGSAAAGSNAVYAHKFMMYPENQGYRISIVDATGDRVTNSVDIVNYIPSDINNIGYGNSNNGGGRQEFIDGYNQYINWLGWTDATGTGVNKKNAFYYSSGVKTEEFTRETWSLGGVPSRVNSKGERVETNMYPKAKFEEYITKIYNLKVADLTEKGVESLVPIPEGKNIEIPLPSILNDAKTGFDPGGEILMNAFKSEVGKLGQQENTDDATTKGTDIENKEEIVKEKDAAYNVLSLLVDMAVPIYNNKGQSTEKVDYLFRFTDPSEQARVGKEEPSKTTGEMITIVPSNIITEKGYKVVMEPLYWYVPELLSIHPDLLAKTNGSINYASINGVCYGTVSYLARYMYEIATGTRSDEIGLEDDKMHLCWTGPNWGTSNLGATTLMLAYTDEDLGIYEPGVAPEPLTKVAGRDEWSLHSMASGNNYKQVGYGAHVYDNLLQPDSTSTSKSTSTFDEKTYGDDSDGGYRPGPSEDTSERGGKESKNNVVKFYSKRNDGNYIYISNFTRENTIGRIEIEDELEGGYMVDDWFTSPTFRKPTNNNDDYGNWKSSLENKQSGTTTGNVTLDKNQTLYVRLVEVPEITKIYMTGDVTDKVEVDTNPKFENGSLIVETPDNEYNYIEGVESPESVDPNSWEEVPGGSTTTDTTIPLRDDTKEIYLHYDRISPLEASTMTIWENEISHQFNLADANGGELVEGVRDYAGVSAPPCDYEWTCGGCSGEDDDYCPGHNCPGTMSEVDPGSYAFSIINRPNYNKQFVYKDLQLDPKSWSGSGPGHGGGSKSGTPNMKMLLQRSISDKATLYPQMNGGNEAILQDMGLVASSYRPANSRKDGSKEQATRKTWSETFTTNFTFEDVDDPTIEFEHGGHDSASKGQSSSGSLENMNNTYSRPGNTIVMGLWGKNNSGIKPLDTKAVHFAVDGANTPVNKLHYTFFDKEGSTIKFYPYYKMKFVSELDGAEKDAYLTSENLSELLNVNRVDVSTAMEANGIALKLDSTQWSLHGKAHKLLSENGIGDVNSLLPGGALFDLSIADGNGVWVKFRTYQTAVADGDEIKLADGSVSKTTSQAKNTTEQFRQQVKNVLDNYEIVLRGVEGMTTEVGELRDADQLTGKGHVTSFGGNRLAEDEKYKFEANTGNAAASDLDITAEANHMYIWEFTSDADGNVVVTVNKDGTVTEAGRCSKSDGPDKLLANAELKELNDRTNIVTNFFNSIDRNMGSARDGSRWYNEGFRILLVENRFAFEVGFGNGAPIRSASLNIKLPGKLDSRSDMFTGGEEKTRTFQFRTSKKSTLPEAQSKPEGWVGTFEGMDIRVLEINQLLMSKLFYTGNTTVTDLN